MRKRLRPERWIMMFSLFSDEGLEQSSQLNAVAANIVMNNMYVDRACRHDLPYPVNALARTVSDWSVASGRKLHILAGDMHATRSMTFPVTGDRHATYLSLSVPVDANFGGDAITSSSSAFRCVH